MLTNMAGLITEFGEKEIIELADHNRDEIPDDDVIANAIERAEADIYSYTARRLADLPDPLPARSGEKLRGLANDLARYYLFAGAPTELVLARYEFAMAWLKDFAAGKCELPGITDVTTPPSSRQGPAVVAPALVFSGSVLDKMGAP